MWFPMIQAVSNSVVTRSGRVRRGHAQERAGELVPGAAGGGRRHRRRGRAAAAEDARREGHRPPHVPCEFFSSHVFLFTL